MMERQPVAGAEDTTWKRATSSRPIHLAGPDSEFSFDFVQKMANRMATSFHRYGALAEAYPEHAEALASMRERLEKYADSGNTEWLIDAANYLMIEYMHPSHPRAHFEATDSDSSAGRMLWGGSTEAGRGFVTDSAS